MRTEELWKREKELQKKERWRRIKESIYNEWYKSVKEEGVPGYLKKRVGESRWQRVARFRARKWNKGGGILGGRGEKEV